MYRIYIINSTDHYSYAVPKSSNRVVWLFQGILWVTERIKDRTHDATLRAILRATVLGRVDTRFNIRCNIDGVATKLCKQGNLIG